MGGGKLVGSLPAHVARRSLKPQLNQIRTWVRQGRTDAWIAHQLEVSVSDLRSFKREHDLAPADEAGAEGYADEELDLRAEDDALVAAALDAEPEEEEEDEAAEDRDTDGGGPDAETAGRRRRRRGRRGGRGRRRTRGHALEGTFDHGEEGYGLWLDPAVQDDGVYAEYWAGHRPVTITIEPDRIVIRRAGEEEEEAEDEDGDEVASPDEEPDEVTSEDRLD
jgi:hypothetical protein